MANTVEAVIADADVTSGGAVTLTALDDTTIDSDVVAAAVSASFSSSSLSGALAVGVVYALNTIDNTTRAVVEDGADVDATGGFTASAESTSQISAVGAAASVSIAASSGSLGLSVRAPGPWWTT